MLMMFPEFNRHQKNSMKPSKSFLKGLRRRLFLKRRQKVFVIGFHKTGTTSLGKALQILGYKVCGSLKEGYNYRKYNDPKTYIWEQAKDLLPIYEAFQDTPWFLFYKELYEMHPDAYFILTIRPEEKWLRSVQKHFGNKKFKYHDLIYDTSDSMSNGSHYIAKYKKHNEEVVAFFQGNPRFKILHVEDVEWKEIGDFLGIDPPKTKFPHANKAGYRKSWSLPLKRLIKRRYYK